ncbi:orotidine-5'-phosphate decarboxylase [Candidatus Woesearchaeota archaeon]|nr:orotidine-5'-phosphate decarboxylase [Candidatus Woesearchaeota archaeon]
MDFPGILEKKAEDCGNIICLGMDPVIERIPVEEKSIQRKIVKFYSGIVSAALAENVRPAAVKPNYAFFAQYGFPGLRALKSVIRLCARNKLLVILDAKRGDVGSTSQAYAREVFGFWKADAVTVSPYMGFDSVEPFLAYCNKGKGVYVLVKTSNKGSFDFQSLDCGGSNLFMRVSRKIIEWHRDGICAVAGATSLTELSDVCGFFAGSGKKIPLLIPGVGAQGGSARDVVAALKSSGSSIGMHRINSSSSVNYAYEKEGSSDFAGAAARELKSLVGETRGF